MTRHARRRDALRTHPRWHVPDGVSLIELLCAVVVVGVLGTATFTGVTSYNRMRRASQVAGLLEWEVTVARSYAIRSGRPMAMFVDESGRTVVLRDGPSTRRTISLGDGTRLRVDSITLDLPGDSLVFSPRGLCVNCTTDNPPGISVAASGRVVTIRIGVLGDPPRPMIQGSQTN